jgi:hypothetical protein
VRETSRTIPCVKRSLFGSPLPAMCSRHCDTSTTAFPEEIGPGLPFLFRLHERCQTDSPGSQGFIEGRIRFGLVQQMRQGGSTSHGEIGRILFAEQPDQARDVGKPQSVPALPGLRKSRLPLLPTGRTAPADDCAPGSATRASAAILPASDSGDLRPFRPVPARPCRH